jgi:hypothetical protein
MIADIFPGKVSSTSSGNDLNPVSVNDWRRIRDIAGAKVPEPRDRW